MAEKPARLLMVVVLWYVPAGQAREPGPQSLPEFHVIDQASVRKQEFFDYLRPLVRAENERIHAQRQQLLRIVADHRAGRVPDRRDQWFLERLTRDYRLDPEGMGRSPLFRELVRRVDVIPLSLVLAQAAKESGWGASRFARQGNNLFGQRCFERGCGVVPRDRAAGETHEVRRFDSVRASVASYMRNLNTHPGYRALRMRRERLRDIGQALSGTYLAEGLDRYSERGEVYVREVQTMIRQNGLERSMATSAGGGAPVSGL